uniref:Uncharacterized protein n=1 Tax=Knipowitschia caucasica TaxID=637954 RepID=A0AAV2J3H3_KNICA
MQRDSDLALTLHYKSRRSSQAICRYFGMFWGNPMTPAVERMKSLEDLDPLQNKKEYTVLRQLHQTLPYKSGNLEVAPHELCPPRNLLHPPLLHDPHPHKLNLRLLKSLFKRSKGCLGGHLVQVKREEDVLV